MFQLKERDENRAGVFWGLLALLVLGVLSAGAAWPQRMGLLALVTGFLMIRQPGVAALPRRLGGWMGGFWVLGLGFLLPATWFGIPEWREELESLGVFTGDRVGIQWQWALEMAFFQGGLILIALWMLGLRASTRTAKRVGLGFLFAVAGYAFLSQIFRGQLHGGLNSQHFGFFPNRNHSGNFLSLGFVVGFGLAFQSLRSKEYLRLALSLLAVIVIAWASLSWNISRAAIILSLIGTGLWGACLGRRYFGRQEWKGLGLAALLIVGVFGISEFQVKERLSETVEKATDSWGEDEKGDDELEEGENGENGEKGEEGGETRGRRRLESLSDLDFRIPVALDTFEMLREAPLTGVGGGQFRWVFPHYRYHTIVASEAVALHPESSWLLVASEHGIPAALLLLGVVVWLFVRGYRNIRRPGARDRAMRFGFLVAAALVPIHGFFDVPAHRPYLMMASLLLYALSQNPPAFPEGEDNRRSRLPSLLGGAFLLGSALLLLGGPALGLRPPLPSQSKEQLAKGTALYDRVSDRRDPLEPFEALKVRAEIRELASEALVEAPLNPRFYRLRGLASLPLQFDSAGVVRDFEVDRRLVPYSVKIPLIQAKAALYYHPPLVVTAWEAALERSARIDLMKGLGDSATVNRTRREIQRTSKRAPNLKKEVEPLLAEETIFE